MLDRSQEVPYVPSMVGRCCSVCLRLVVAVIAHRDSGADLVFHIPSLVDLIPLSKPPKSREEENNGETQFQILE